MLTKAGRFRCRATPKRFFLRAELSAGVGTTIATKRKACRLSQGGLARKAGVDHRTVARIERGQRPSAETLLLIATALGVEIYDLCPRWGTVVMAREAGIASLGLGLRDARLRAGVTLAQALRLPASVLRHCRGLSGECPLSRAVSLLEEAKVRRITTSL
ncbi:helix-turn-helix transcriptional regulator [Sphingomonadaceae bacterium LXI357]|uniref:Helix-turn-helix transcriptional regulator n=1 Tax=Stakelama marina TaxID=2826939 RepID=A0A8T4IH65_9SPHN|nr:helix-turn-helix transcriptional regulator [Stakelama marina]